MISSYNTSIESIESAFEKLRQALEQRQEHLTQQVTRLRDDKLKQLDSMSSHLDLMNEWTQSLIRESLNLMPTTTTTPLPSAAGAAAGEAVESAAAGEAVKVIRQCKSFCDQISSLIGQWNETKLTTCEEMESILGPHQITFAYPSHTNGNANGYGYANGTLDQLVAMITGFGDVVLESPPQSEQEQQLPEQSQQQQQIPEPQPRPVENYWITGDFNLNFF